MIAAASDVSEKTIYHYFPSKGALVFDSEPTLVDVIRSTFPLR